ncbi:hypothetical protein GCM10009642_33320 [Nocardiopsis metallicus]
MPQSGEDGIVEGGTGFGVGDLDTEVIKHGPSVARATDILRMAHLRAPARSSLWKLASNPAWL